MTVIRKRRPMTHFWDYDDARDHIDELCEFLNGPDLTAKDIKQIELATAGDAFRRRQRG